MAVTADASVRVAEHMLADAYELVLAGWCQGAGAKDAYERPIEPSSAFARSWSAPGALARVYTRATTDLDGNLDAFQRANLALAAVVHAVPQEWNDVEGRTIREVLDALAHAVQLLGEPEYVDDVESLDAVRESPSRSRG
jgi:hypothetical protein